MGDTTMTTYTAEEFARVKFARHLSGRAIGIRRPVVGDSQVWEFEDPIHPTRWRSTDDQGMASMSHEGWIPVVETQQAVRERDAWRKQAYDLREELNRQDLQPLTLDALAAAWEAAEVPTDDNPIREGDETDE